MARGKSGRIIIDVDPEFKEEVYQALTNQGYRSMKEWFLLQAQHICEESKQPSLKLVAEDQAPYKFTPQNH